MLALRSPGTIPDGFRIADGFSRIFLASFVSGPLALLA
jgi:hypothetical protein